MVFQYFPGCPTAGADFGEPLLRREEAGGTNPDRQEYVPAATIETLIEADPDPEWRALLSLARYLGLRTPSEPFSLCWSHVDWERKRLHIPSPKTECHGKPYRVAPILPEVMPHLEALYTTAPREADTFSSDCGSGVPSRRRSAGSGRT